jgi:hypothetical protein
VEWLDYKLVPRGEIQLSSHEGHRELVDNRHIESPAVFLRDLRSNSSPQVWREGSDGESVAGNDRFHLMPNDILVIWTIPPDRSELAAAVERVQPKTIYIFGSHPGLKQFAPFIERLSGLVKFALRRPGQPVELASLAAALAHQVSTVRLGLAWLEAKGVIVSEPIAEEQILLRRGTGEPSPNLKQTEASLNKSLEETEAFRRFYLRQSLDKLL